MFCVKINWFHPGLWSLVFLFSNLSLFVFLPFAYLFNESEGFPGHRKVIATYDFLLFNRPVLITVYFVLQGLKARLYETCTVLMLLSICVLVLTYLFYTFFYTEQSLLHMMFSEFWLLLRFITAVSLFYDFNLTDLSTNYLPFLYSCISFIGVLMLLSNYEFFFFFYLFRRYRIL